MPNILSITVENPEQILNAGAYDAGALVRLQWSATQAGSFADVSGTGSTPTLPIVAGTRAYTGYDPAGTVSTWYRTRFENAGASRLSDWTTAFQAAPTGSGLLCNLYDVKHRLDILASDTSQDEDILDFIGQVSTGIMGYTGRRFARNPASGETTFLFDVNRQSRVLHVPKGIASMSQLEVASVTGGAFSVVDPTTWFLDPPYTDLDYGWPATRITLSDAGSLYFTPGKRVVRATMAEGWASVPADIQGIARRATLGGYLAKGSGRSGEALVGPSGALVILRGISPEDHATLDWYAARAF